MFARHSVRPGPEFKKKTYNNRESKFKIVYISHCARRPHLTWFRLNLALCLAHYTVKNYAGFGVCRLKTPLKMNFTRLHCAVEIAGDSNIWCISSYDWNESATNGQLRHLPHTANVNRTERIIDLLAITASYLVHDIGLQRLNDPRR